MWGMVQAADGSCFTLEAFPTPGVTGQMFGQDLDRDPCGPGAYRWPDGLRPCRPRRSGMGPNAYRMGSTDGFLFGSPKNLPQSYTRMKTEVKE